MDHAAPQETTLATVAAGRAAANRFGAGSVAPHPGTQVPAGPHVAAGTV
jgi:hypothetical protein